MLKKILIIFTALILSVLFFELFLKYSPFEYGTSPVEYDKDIGMWHKKGYAGYIIKECYKTKYIFNNQGLPKSIYAFDQKKNSVIILGDSFIEALMVKNKNIIHNALAKEFDNKYNFINYGLSGSSPTQQFVILKKKVNLDHAKYVIQFINLENDLNDVDSKNLSDFARPKVYVEFKTLDEYTVIAPRKKRFYDDIQDFIGNLQIYIFIKKVLYYVKSHLSHNKKSLSHSANKEKPKDLRKNWLYLKGAIHQINQYIQSVNDSIEYKLIIVSDDHENKKIIEEFLNKEHIEFIFLKDVAQSKKVDLKTFQCDGHWNDETHKNIAKIMKEIKFLK